MTDFVCDTNGTHWRLDQFTHFKIDGDTTTATRVLPDGGEEHVRFDTVTWNSVLNATRPYIPVAPSIEAIEAILDDDGELTLTRTPIIAWRVDDDGWLVPVTYSDSDRLHNHAVLFPDGRVQEIGNQWPTLDDFLRDREAVLRRQPAKAA